MNPRWWLWLASLSMAILGVLGLLAPAPTVAGVEPGPPGVGPAPSGVEPGTPSVEPGPSGRTEPAPAPPPSQPSSPSPSPSRSSDPCGDSGVIVDDFVMWDGVGENIAEVPVHATKPCPVPRAIVFMTFDITAKAGEDYVGIPRGLVILPAGATRTTIPIKIIHDNIPEPPETFGVRLLSGARFEDPVGIVTIRDQQ